MPTMPAKPPEDRHRQDDLLPHGNAAAYSAASAFEPVMRMSQPHVVRHSKI